MFLVQVLFEVYAQDVQKSKTYSSYSSIGPFVQYFSCRITKDLYSHEHFRTL